MAKRSILGLAGLLVLALGGQAAAEMYKWIDESGHVQYSQIPPPGAKAETVKPPPKVDTQNAVDELKSREKGFDDRKKAETKQAETEAKKTEDAAKKQQACETARKNLEGLQGSPQKSFKTDANGNRVRITEEERQERLAAAQKIIDKNCK